MRPDEALFAGLVHDIGRFYLLARATRYPELTAYRDELDSVILEWHPAIGQAILQQLSLPENLTTAVAEHEVSAPRVPARNLTDLVVLANLAARVREGRAPLEPGAGLAADSPVIKVLDDARAELAALTAALR
jgi:HD-like signal output (HDOD) protein